MSGWDDGWRSYRRQAKKPPPEHGLKLKKAGTTWWGERWIAALQQVLRGDEGRLSRGRTYARAGRVHDLVVKDGGVAAEVTGSAAKPYKVAIALAQLDAAQWNAAIAAMAAKAQFAAELLGGHMPQEIDELFRTANAGLFPRKRAELATSCSCPDVGDPCKHIAATHYLLGEALDRDPFLLFELRGRSKDAVLDALRAARSGMATGARAKAGKRKTGPAAEPQHAESARDEAEGAAGVTLEKMAAADYDRPRAELPALHFAFDPPATSGAVLRQLGKPAAWSDELSPADALAPLVRAASEAARKIALAEPAASPPQVSAAAKPRRPRRGSP